MTQYLLAPFRFLIDWLVRFIEDDGLASAGYLAYLGLMSLLPFLVFVFTLLGLIGRADEGAGIVDMMFRFMPTEVALTLQEPVVQVVGTASGGVLTLSLVVVLWIAASGVEGIRTALNRAYRARETRGYWRRRANSSVLVIFFSGFIIIAIGCMVIGPLLWQQAEGYLDFGISLGPSQFPEIIRFGAGGGRIVYCDGSALSLIAEPPTILDRGYSGRCCRVRDGGRGHQPLFGLPRTFCTIRGDLRQSRRYYLHPDFLLSAGGDIRAWRRTERDVVRDLR